MHSDKYILLVDDIELNRMLLRVSLEDDYRILEAENGREALKLMEAHSEDIESVVLDLLMPVMDGYAFLEEYSKVEAWRNIPVLVATADKNAEIETRCLRLGAWDFVFKPFDPVNVCLRLEKNIERRHIHELEQQQIKDTFQRYVDPSVLDELLRKGVTAKNLEGRMAELAVLFVDMRGFTRLSEQLKPERLLQVLNEFLSLNTECVKRHGGTVDKFIGDCVMAFWGAPLPCKDAAYQACAAAVDMAREGEEFFHRIHEESGYQASFGVGIHYGECVVGNIGTPSRKDYTAVGDAVNTAARLEAGAPPGTIYISRSVVKAAGRRIKTTALGKMHFKGKQKMVEVFTLDGLREE